MTKNIQYTDINSVIWAGIYKKNQELKLTKSATALLISIWF